MSIFVVYCSFNVNNSDQYFQRALIMLKYSLSCSSCDAPGAENVDSQSSQWFLQLHVILVLQVSTCACVYQVWIFPYTSLVSSISQCYVTEVGSIYNQMLQNELD